MAEEESEKEIEEEIQERFSFEPGSSQTALQKYHSARRKRIDVTPSPPAAPAQIGEQWKITLADRITKERCSRRIQVGGTFRKPYINLPEEWVLWWYSNFRDKKDIAPIVDLEFSADKNTITIRKRPPAEGMEKSIYDDDNIVTEVHEIDSDKAAELDEIEREEKESAKRQKN
jgi:hypothetical protein